MPYLCSYEFCKHNKEIDEGKAFACSKCGNKAFHKDCVEQHIKEKHDGKAEIKELKELDWESQ